MLVVINKKKHKTNDTIIGMITFLFCLTILLSLIKMAEKAIKNYDYGHINIDEFKHINKDSFFFK